jgi:hypothetical protein
MNRRGGFLGPTLGPPRPFGGNNDQGFFILHRPKSIFVSHSRITSSKALSRRDRDLRDLVVKISQIGCKFVGFANYRKSAMFKQEMCSTTFGVPEAILRASSILVVLLVLPLNSTSVLNALVGALKE